MTRNFYLKCTAEQCPHNFGERIKAVVFQTMCMMCPHLEGAGPPKKPMIVSSNFNDELEEINSICGVASMEWETWGYMVFDIVARVKHNQIHTIDDVLSGKRVLRLTTEVYDPVKHPEIIRGGD